jgi:hypothetical protein
MFPVDAEMLEIFGARVISPAVKGVSMEESG